MLSSAVGGGISLAPVSVSRTLLGETFETLRRCGRGRRECQVLWLSSWAAPDAIRRIVHPSHSAHGGGFAVESRWVTALWLDLAKAVEGVRIQVHTHPGAAFHSKTDDDWPIVRTPGFLSLVIPNFALGPISLADSYLAMMGTDGGWHEVDPLKTILTTA